MQDKETNLALTDETSHFDANTKCGVRQCSDKLKWGKKWKPSPAPIRFQHGKGNAANVEPNQYNAKLRQISQIDELHSK